MSLSDDINKEEEIAELRRALKASQQAEYKAKRKTEALVDAVYTAAKESVLACGNGKAQKIAIPPKDPRKTKAEVALVHATDWQNGKLTTTYNIQKCSDRMEQLAAKVIELTTVQRSHHPVRECTVMFGGDMVEGISIFPGQAWEVEAHIFEQLFETVRIEETLIRTFAAFFDKVNVVCEFGNHGRLGRKGEMPANDNIDAISYRIAQDRTKDLKNVTWQMSPDWYQMVTIGNYKAMLVHGDECRGMSGILRKANAWATGVVEPFQDVYMGHFHTPTTMTMANAGRVFITGSPESHNEYAREVIAAVGKPSQRLHFIDPVKGRVTAEYTIWLE